MDKEPKLEPTELLDLNGKLYVVFTTNRILDMDKDLDHYLKDKKLVEYECYKKTKA